MPNRLSSTTSRPIRTCLRHPFLSRVAGDCFLHRKGRSPMRVLPAPEAAKFVRGRAVRHVVAFTVLVGWSLICLFPLYWMGISSIKSIEDVANGPAYVPSSISPPLSTLGDIFYSRRATIRWDVSRIRRSFLRVRLQLQSSSADSRLSVSCALNVRRAQKVGCLLPCLPPEPFRPSSLQFHCTS